MAKRKKSKVTLRNYVAVAAFQHGGAGMHKDRKKEASKKACRGRMSHD